MRIITGFEDPSVDSEKNSFEEYGQIFQALTHNQEVAENVFARVAKKALKRLIGESRFREAKDARGMVPTWVTESSVVLVLPAAGTKNLDEWFNALDSLAECVAYHLQSSVKKRSYVLVDPLSTRIQQIGENIYRFGVKQKWALETKSG